MVNTVVRLRRLLHVTYAGGASLSYTDSAPVTVAGGCWAVCALTVIWPLGLVCISGNCGNQRMMSLEEVGPRVFAWARPVSVFLEFAEVLGSERTL